MSRKKNTKAAKAAKPDAPLKCCPFCGCVELVLNRTNEESCWVSCSDCGAMAEDSPQRDGAISNWNDRLAEDDPAHFVEDDEA